MNEARDLDWGDTWELKLGQRPYRARVVSKKETLPAELSSFHCSEISLLILALLPCETEEGRLHSSSQHPDVVRWSDAFPSCLS